MFRLSWAALVCVLAVRFVEASTVALWDFNSVPPDGDTATGTLLPAEGGGEAGLVGGVTASFTAANGSGDPAAADNSNWRISGWPAQGTQNKQNGVRFNVSTVGYRRIRMTWDQRHSNTASKYVRLQYTTNGTDFMDFRVLSMPAETWVNGQSVSFPEGVGVEDNPWFAVRFVTEFERTATGGGLNGYVPSNPGSTYGSAGTLRLDRVTFLGEPALERFSVFTYNVLGNGATNWSPDLPQVQAVGRQLMALRPDVIGLQEVPEACAAQMTNLLSAWLPDYQLVLGQRTDGAERSAVASRFPIRRAQSWLARSNLNAFGYDGVFTRDLFEAEIAVPGFPQPLHFFTTHLKAYTDEASATRRAAEARAISNHFVTQFLLKWPSRAYVLVGDMNEDVDRPRQYEQGALQTLTSPPTGLRLTTPRNPVTLDERTWSIRNDSLTIRFDYVLPCGFLFSNTVYGQVFRSDKVSSPLPPLQAGDSREASDHLPVLMCFGNPFVPPRIHAAAVQGGMFSFAWSSQPGQSYRIETSSNGLTWVSAGRLRVLEATNGLYSVPVQNAPGFFRVVREL